MIRERISGMDEPQGGGRFVARATRFDLSVALRYRVAGSDDDWYMGVVQNISRSGVAFRGQIDLHRGVEVAFTFELLGAPTHDADVHVGCQGSGVRVLECDGACDGMAVAFKRYRMERRAIAVGADPVLTAAALQTA